MPLDVNLNPEQREAVEHGEGPLLILAGAGSGKTRVLAARAAHLVRAGRARPWQILALTFTNRAAGELKTRVATMIDSTRSGKSNNPAGSQIVSHPNLSEGHQVVAGTFHGIFARILRREGLNIGVDPNFTIVDSDDQRRLIKAILKELEIPTDMVRAAAVHHAISRAKEALSTPEQMEAEAVYPFHQYVAKVWQRYETRLRRMSGLDFDDLLVRSYRAIQEHPDFLERLQRRFHYILVDEFQDTNRVQYLLVRDIALARRNLNAVGDDDQSIYGFRGATIQNILDFERDWTDAKIIRLEQNYRSTRHILDAAWVVIRHNRARRPKKLWTERQGGSPVELLELATDDDEAYHVVQAIEDEHRRGRMFKEQAILYRTNAQSLKFEQALRTAQTPYHVVGGLKFYERKEVKDIIAYLRLLVNPADDISLLRIINHPPRGIGAGVIQEIQARARADSTSLFAAIQDILGQSIAGNESTSTSAGAESCATELSSRQTRALGDFAELIGKYRQALADSTDYSKAGAESYPTKTGMDDLVEKLVAEIKLPERLLAEEKDDPSHAESRIANLNALLNDINEYFDVNPEGGLAGYLEQVALVSEADDFSGELDRVNLLTLHSAKGLEFPVVFVTGLEEGLFPLSPPDGSAPDVEEERRLFYVGATRAMDRLVLSFAVDRLRWGASSRWQGRSRFIAEIPPEMLMTSSALPTTAQTSFESSSAHNHIGDYSPSHTRPSRSQRSSARKESLHDAEFERQYASSSNGKIALDDLHKGKLVHHAKFGLGVVVGLNRRGQDSRIQVDFDSVGIKTLVYKYAPLTAAK